MITIGYSTRNSNPEFQEYLKKSCGNPKIQVIEKVNNGEKNLSQVYNEIISESQNDIVVLCHDDIYFDTKNWGEKLKKIFDRNPEYSIVGVAGSTFLPKSGMWWEDRSKMIGIVNHEHEGKKWESKYSDSLQNNVKEVVIVDGLFISFDKNKIESLFDELVPGFHFYDVNFCFNNFTNNCKIGVITNIRITHKSIGMTNEQWEKNRLLFSEKNNDLLPVKIKINDNDKIKVLIGCLFFKEFTGSEMYVYELSKNLIKQNVDVSVVAYETEGPLSNIAKSEGIKVFNITNPPGFKLGDGVWRLNTPNGSIISEKNKFYKIGEEHFDIIHYQHHPVVNILNNLYPNVSKVYTIHSEVISLENPVINETVQKYIAIRPEIKEHLINNFGIDSDTIDVIYNPIDTERFNTQNIKDDNYILFVGTIDELRKNTIFDLIDYSNDVGKDLWIVGADKSNYTSQFKYYGNVKYFPSTKNVEKFVKNCSETAGILLGRTTIEGWLCGKPGWIYNIDSDGNIINKTFNDVPQDTDKFNSLNVVKQIKEIYLNTINKL
jgi:hypothetical protein